MGSSTDLDFGSRLSDDEAFVWYTDVSRVADPCLLAEYESLLGEEERRRHQTFCFGEDRHLYLVAHALLRASLSRCSDIHPAAWKFSSEEGGRPELTTDEPHHDRIRFNLSHTRGLAACVIARDVSVGIDVERLDRRVDAESIASRYFSDEESQHLAALSADERTARFLEYWTLKESYVKANGGGLSIPLDSFSFRHECNDAWRIHFVGMERDPDDWQFVCLKPTPEHVMSIAIHRPGQTDYHIRINNTVPLTMTV